MTVDELYRAAFATPRDPVSEEYQFGIRAALAFWIEGKEAVNPYWPGSARSDAFEAGCSEGQRIYRIAEGMRDIGTEETHLDVETVVKPKRKQGQRRPAT